MLQNIDYLMNIIDCLKIRIFSHYIVSKDLILCGDKTYVLHLRLFIV